MTEQDYELLSQYLDGELAAAVAQELRKRLIAEPKLRASLEHMRTVDRSVTDAFDVPGADAVPARVVKMVENTRTRTGELPLQRRAGWGLAIAASLVAATGLLLTPDWRQQAPQYPDGRVTGEAQLARVLEYSASRADGWDTLEDGRQVRPLLSFQNTEGGWCREYLLSGEGGTWRGVACRSEGQWTTEVLSTGAFPGSANEYRPAGTTDADEITSFINSHSADIALSLKEEAEVIAGRWQ
jgi:negative regulator of sigma E activity